MANAKFYVSAEDAHCFSNQGASSSTQVITLNYVHTAAEWQPGDIEVQPCDWTADGAPGYADAWCRRMFEDDFKNCLTLEDCQAVVDDACREAGTDSDPAWADRGPMVVFERVENKEE